MWLVQIEYHGDRRLLIIVVDRPSTKMLIPSVGDIWMADGLQRTDWEYKDDEPPMGIVVDRIFNYCDDFVLASIILVIELKKYRKWYDRYHTCTSYDREKKPCTQY